jgi:hypothetical protein
MVDHAGHTQKGPVDTPSNLFDSVCILQIEEARGERVL